MRVRGAGAGVGVVQVEVGPPDGGAGAPYLDPIIVHRYTLASSSTASASASSSASLDICLIHHARQCEVAPLERPFQFTSAVRIDVD